MRVCGVQADLQEAALDVVGQVSASVNGTELLMSQAGLPHEVAARALEIAGATHLSLLILPLHSYYFQDTS